MKLTAKITSQEAYDILTTAIESGAIDYWACDYELFKVHRNSEGLVTMIEFQAEDETEKVQTYRVGQRTIQRGINAVLSSDLDVADYFKTYIVTNEIDSPTSDVIIQAGIFGQILYG